MASEDVVNEEAVLAYEDSDEEGIAVAEQKTVKK